MGCISLAKLIDKVIRQIKQHWMQAIDPLPIGGTFEIPAYTNLAIFKLKSCSNRL